MLLEDYARKNLVTTVPHDIRVWHWTARPGAVSIMGRRIMDAGDCSDLGQGALGPGLYLSTSAVDLMDRGPQVLTAVLRAGTPVLMIDPELFSVGSPELFEMELNHFEWPFSFPDWRSSKVSPSSADPASETAPRLMKELGTPAAAFVLGLHLAFVVPSGSCLQFDPAVDSTRLVADYVRQNPHDRPMLLPRNAVEQWLARQGFMKDKG